jgi:hypothetical protein
MNRQNQILSLILVVQIVLGAVIFFPRSSDDDQPGGPLLKDFSSDEVTQVTITDGDGNTVMLAKQSGEWVLPDAGDYPVETGRVESLLDKIKALQADRLIAVNESSHKRLQVAENQFERLIEIERSGADEADRLYIGSSSGGNATHMRVNDNSKVYLTSGLSAWEASAHMSSWVNTLYLSVPQANVVTLRLENANGVLEFEKIEDEWTLVGLAEDETFAPESFDSLLSQAVAVRMTQPIGTEAEDSFGMDEPAATITLTVQEEVEQPAEESDDTTEIDPMSELDEAADSGDETGAETGDEETGEAEPEVETVETVYTLQIGAQIDDEENSDYVALSSESDYYVQVSASVAQTFIDAVRDDFLTEPEEADAAETIEGEADFDSIIEE